MIDEKGRERGYAACNIAIERSKGMEGKGLGMDKRGE